MGLDVYLRIWTWDRNSADRIRRPAQENIDHQLPKYDIYIGMMSTRFEQSQAFRARRRLASF